MKSLAKFTLYSFLYVGKTYNFIEVFRILPSTSVNNTITLVNLYCKSSNKLPASFKHPHRKIAQGKLQKLNKRTLFSAPGFNNRPLQRACYQKNLVLFENVGWLFESYLVLFSVIEKIFFVLKKFNAKITCLLYEPKCKK